MQEASHAAAWLWMLSGESVDSPPCPLYTARSLARWPCEPSNQRSRPAPVRPI